VFFRWLTIRVENLWSLNSTYFFYRLQHLKAVIYYLISIFSKICEMYGNIISDKCSTTCLLCMPIMKQWNAGLNVAWILRSSASKGPFIATQLKSTSSWVELRRYKRAFSRSYFSPSTETLSSIEYCYTSLKVSSSWSKYSLHCWKPVRYSALKPQCLFIPKSFRGRLFWNTLYK